MFEESIRALEDFIVVCRSRLQHTITRNQIADLLEIIMKMPKTEQHYNLVVEVLDTMHTLSEDSAQENVRFIAFQLWKRWEMFADSVDPEGTNPWLSYPHNDNWEVIARKTINFSS